jgi:hypothetical protein
LTPKEKVRIVIEGIRGDILISVLCRRELGITYTPIQLAVEEAVSSAWRRPFGRIPCVRWERLDRPSKR